MVDYSELDGSPTEHFDADVSTATRQLLCAWNDRIALVQQLLAGGGQVYPHGSNPNFRAISVDPKPQPGEVQEQAVGMAKYEFAVLTVRYSTPQYGERLESETERSYVIALEGTTLYLDLDIAAYDYRWESGEGVAVKETEVPGKLIPGFDYVRTESGVRHKPIGIFDPIGYVNEKEFYCHRLGYRFQPETLLYRNPDLTEVLPPNYPAAGWVTWTITYRLSYRPDTWNLFLDPKTGEFAEIYEPGGARYKPYQLWDFRLDPDGRLSW